MNIIERAGTSFAFPSQSVYLQQTDPPEIMKPPAPSEIRMRAEPIINAVGRPPARGSA